MKISIQCPKKLEQTMIVVSQWSMICSVEGELKYAMEQYMMLYVLMDGTTLMLQWSAESLASLHMVYIFLLYSYFTDHNCVHKYYRSYSFGKWYIQRSAAWPITSYNQYHLHWIWAQVKWLCLWRTNWWLWNCCHHLSKWVSCTNVKLILF